MSRKQVFFPQTSQELFALWKRAPDAVPFAGGTDLVKERETKHSLDLPDNILSLDRMAEFRHVTRTERYIEIGAMVRLNDILTMGKFVPPAFIQAIKNIAGPGVRNLATLGGNICNPAGRMDTAAPLIALDARYELRTAQASRWISASRFSAFPGPLSINPQELLTRIRVPLEPWSYSVYKKFDHRFFAYPPEAPRPPGGERSEGERPGETRPHGASGGSLVFLVRVQKNILTDIRVVFAGETVLRDKTGETILAGKHLPLDQRDMTHFIEQWRGYLAAVETPAPFLRAAILNYIETSIRELAQ